MAKVADDYRYERKFVIPELTIEEIELIVKLHPLLFSEIYHERFVNNIYFDAPDMKNYFDAIEGTNVRLKARIRWYGDLFGDIEKPTLELKVKNGHLIRKESFPLNNFSFNNGFKIGVLKKTIREAKIPGNLDLYLQCLRPVFVSRYRRKYFLSADGGYRITLDSQMEWCRLNTNHNNFLHKTSDKLNNVLELKYASDQDGAASHVAEYFSFRLGKSSKYVAGIERLDVR